jgi:2,3-bisphosphoglycerate-independent phosphoglycerate mutase
MRSPVVLIVRDGWGENPNREHDAFNAVKLAKTPVDDALRRDWPWTLIKTSGEDVGLPTGVMGNSEVGHQNIGAGRIVDQEIMRITRRIRDGSFFENAGLRGAFEHAAKTGGNVHIMGLVSNGQVHSDLEHCFALIDLAGKMKFPGDRVLVHAFTDGRDTGPKTGLGFVRQLEAKLLQARAGRIASVIGRYWVMDRDHRWERVAWAYACLTGQATTHAKMTTEMLDAGRASSAAEAVERYYAHPADASRTGDEFIPPTMMVGGGKGSESVALPRIVDGDSVILFNFRGDRPREITKAFVLDDAAWSKVPNGGFDRGKRIANLYYCTMTGYEAGLPVSAVAFEKPPKMPAILGQVVSDAGLKQFRCAETEKFPHVTFIFNDYREEPFAGETRELIQSPTDVATYDQKPEMSAEGVCEAVLRRLRAADCESLIVVNFANPDMVGHAGKLDAVIKAVETVDACVGRIVDAALAKEGALIITADHGNAEQMWDPVNNSPHTAHTTYDVPLFVVGEAYRGKKLRPGGRLADIAPTALEMMGMVKPQAMTGQSLMK